MKLPHYAGNLSTLKSEAAAEWYWRSLMWTFLQDYRDREDGAVTVDWVLLTAGMIALALGTILFFNNGVNNIGDVVVSLVTGFVTD
jgi:hypothetical protein